MSRRPLPGLAASLLAHAALIAGAAFIVPRADRLPPLFVDLTQDPGAGPGSPPATTPWGTTTARRPAPPRAPAWPAAQAPRAVEPPAPADVPATPAAPAPLAPAPPPSATAPPPAGTAPADPQAAAAAVTSPRSSDAVPAALRAAAPDGVVSPSTGNTDTRGDVVVSDHAGDGLGARGGQGLALARPGAGPGDPAAGYAGYLAGLRQRVQEALGYPPPARRRGLAGTVTLEVTVLPSGAIGPVAVVESSSHALLDEAALATVRSLRAEPFPAHLPPRALRVRLPVVFQLR
jgi:protein TonB